MVPNVAGSQEMVAHRAGPRAGAALRLWFIHAYPEVPEGDPLIYGDIAKNWMLTASTA